MEEQQRMIPPLNIDGIGQGYLTSIARWNRFIAIASIVGGGVLLVFALTVTVYHLSGPLTLQESEPESTYKWFIIFVICVVVFLFPCFFRLRFSNRMLRALKDGDRNLLNQSLLQCKLYSKYWGITTIVLVALVVVVIILGLGMNYSRNA